MPLNPALLVRFDPAHREEALAETRALLARIGEPDAVVKIAASGDIKAIPEGDPHEAQRAITRLAAHEPRLFRHTASWTVADQFVHGDLDTIRRAVASYQDDIGRHDTWKIAVRHKDTRLHSKEVIDAVAPLIHNRHVDLDNPSKEIRIDILGDEAAIGLLPRSELFRNDHSGQ